MHGKGFLIIWSDVEPERETDYIHWMTREHAIERVSTDGFVAMRLFRAIAPDVRRYLISYELESADVVNSAAYVAKLNNPTPWTKRTLPQVKNFIRGGGRLVHSAGIGQGGYVTALTWAGPAPQDGAALVAALARCDRIAAARLYETDQARTSVATREKEDRKAQSGAGDRSFAGVLFIEGADEDALRATLARLRQDWPQIERGSTVGALTYATVFGLEKRTL